MVSDTITAVAIYLGVMCVLGVAAFYLKWDRHG
jgi:hypothetical protein